jgi:hypothetical protein
MTRDREDALSHQFCARVGAVFEDVMEQVRASAQAQDEVDRFAYRLMCNVMMLAATMHLDRETDDNASAFVDLAQFAYLCALPVDDGRVMS